MADKLVEFINADVSFADLTAGTDLITTSATQTASVTDLSLETEANLANAVLSVGGAKVATANGQKSVFTGREIIPPESALHLKMDANWFLNGIYAAYRGDNDFQFKPFVTKYGDFSGALQPSGQGTMIAPGFSVNPEFFCFSASGDFYYSDVGNTTIYKRAGGVSGAQSSMGGVGYTPVYDGERYIYALDGNEIRKLDTTNDSVTHVASTSSVSSSYCRAAYIDGYLFIWLSYNMAMIRVVNTATGTVLDLNAFSTGSAQRYFLQVGKRANGDYIVVMTNYTTPVISWWNLGSDLSTINVFESGTLNESFYEYAGQDQQLHRHPEMPHLIFYLDQYYWQILDLETLSLGPRETVNGIIANDCMVPVFDPAVAAADFSPVRVRATGVLTEE